MTSGNMVSMTVSKEEFRSDEAKCDFAAMLNMPWFHKTKAQRLNLGPEVEPAAGSLKEEAENEFIIH